METFLTFLLVFAFIVCFVVFLFELIELTFRLKEVYLRNKIAEFLSNFGDENLLNNFFNHPLYAQSVLNTKGLPLRTPDAYHFGLIFWDILSNSDDKNLEGINTNINNIKNVNTRNIISNLVKNTNFTSEKLIHQISDWYSQFTIKILVTYKNRIRIAFYLLTLLIVLAFDIDAINIFHSIFNFSIIQLEELSATFTQFMKEPFGIGWHYLTLPGDFSGWLFKILGWIIATVLIAGIGFKGFLWLNASTLNTVFITKATDYFLLDEIYASPTIPNTTSNAASDDETSLPINISEPTSENKEINFQNIEFIQRPVG